MSTLSVRVEKPRAVCQRNGVWMCCERCAYSFEKHYVIGYGSTLAEAWEHMWENLNIFHLPVVSALELYLSKPMPAPPADWFVTGFITEAEL